MIAEKLASQVVQKAVENTQAETKPLSNNGPSSFSEMLQNTGEEQDFVNMMGMKDTETVSGQTQAISAESIPFNANNSNGNQFEPGQGQKVTDMLADFNQQQVHMDNLVNDVLYSGKKFSNQELLAIQASVFHYSQMTELTVKVVELGTSSFKGVMNTQIQ
ncbi:MAG: hypothetical protein HY877_05810 [Deltaproteobacteria bacterium]|nr:hypothetical protein [Deltaproteobacteria bacterium]